MVCTKLPAKKMKRKPARGGPLGNPNNRLRVFWSDGLLKQNHLARPRAVVLTYGFPLTKAETTIRANKHALHTGVSHFGLLLKKVEELFLALVARDTYT